jgi:hypothetical protein
MEFKVINECSEMADLDCLQSPDGFGFTETKFIDLVVNGFKIMM